MFTVTFGKALLPLPWNIAQYTVSVRFDGKIQTLYEARTFRILRAKNYRYWFRFRKNSEIFMVGLHGVHLYTLYIQLLFALGSFLSTVLWKQKCLVNRQSQFFAFSPTHIIDPASQQHADTATTVAVAAVRANKVTSSATSDLFARLM